MNRERIGEIFTSGDRLGSMHLHDAEIRRAHEVEHVRGDVVVVIRVVGVAADGGRVADALRRLRADRNHDGRSLTRGHIVQIARDGGGGFRAAAGIRGHGSDRERPVADQLVHQFDIDRRRGTEVVDENRAVGRRSSRERAVRLAVLQDAQVGRQQVRDGGVELQPWFDITGQRSAAHGVVRGPHVGDQRTGVLQQRENLAHRPARTHDVPDDGKGARHMRCGHRRAALVFISVIRRRRINADARREDVNRSAVVEVERIVVEDATDRHRGRNASGYTDRVGPVVIAGSNHGGNAVGEQSVDRRFAPVAVARADALSAA